MGTPTVTELLEVTRSRLQASNIPADDQREILQLVAVLVDTALQANHGMGSSESQRLLDDVFSNTHLLTIIRQQAAELDALKRITYNLTSNLNLQDVLNAVCAEAMALVRDARNAHMFLYEDGKLTFGASLDDHGIENRMLATPRQNGITRTVAMSGEMVEVPDMQKHPIFANTPPDWTGSILGVPMKIKGKVIGVMSLSRHTVGNFSNEEMRLMQLLANQAAIAINNARMHEISVDQARHDTLTGLPNRRALDERLDEEIRRAARTGRGFAIVMMDLDGFKSINDTFGHGFGDDVLRSISNFLADNIRASDFIARYGGDELTMILPEIDLDATAGVVVKLRNKLEKFLIGMPDGTMRNMHISGGLAIYPLHGNSSATLLRAADEALYRAKKHARGKFVVARSQTGDLSLSSYHEY